MPFHRQFIITHLIHMYLMIHIPVTYQLSEPQPCYIPHSIYMPHLFYIPLFYMTHLVYIPLSFYMPHFFYLPHPFSSSPLGQSFNPLQCFHRSIHILSAEQNQAFGSLQLSAPSSTTIYLSNSHYLIILIRKKINASILLY